MATRAWVIPCGEEEQHFRTLLMLPTHIRTFTFLGYLVLVLMTNRDRGGGLALQVSLHLSVETI